MTEFRVLVLAVVLFILSACVPATDTAPPTVTPPSTTAATVTALPTITPIPHTPTASPPTATPTITPIPPTPTPEPIGELTAETSAGWDQFVNDLEADDAASAQSRVNDFWAEVTKEERIPLILDDAAILLYKGDANSVTWRGDFSFWEFGKGLDGTRIGNTDLWYAVADFPRDSRTDYQIVLNGSNWILDPANPHTRRGGLGDNSVLTMPDFQVTDFTKREPGVPAGTITDWIPFESKAMSTTVNYRVYTPPNFDKVDHVPVLYVTDGNDFSDERIGAMQVVADNLIAQGKIQPMMLVFIDAREASNPDNNIRETQLLAQSDKFAEFIAHELVPNIDARYRTNPTRDARALVGTSYGGVFTTFAGLKYPEVFGRLAIFSPAYWVFDSPDTTGNSAFAAGARRMDAVVQNALKTPPSEPSTIFMSTGLDGWDVGELDSMSKPLQQLGNTVQVFHVQEGHSWGAWAGLTDEMLEYLFPPTR